VRQFSDDERRRRPNVIGGGMLWCGRGGEGGGDGWCEVRRNRAALYRCRGGGRRSNDGGAEAVPLMAMVHQF
jgi:hypothetical protein